MVDEMRVMRMNILRWKAVHHLLFGASSVEAGKWFVPSTLEDFQEETKWTHVLSARLVPIAHADLRF